MIFDLFPVILFFVAFKFKGIFFATAVAISASAIQIGYVYFKKRKVEPMLWIGFLVILFFGGATLLFKNETFIKWKPTVLYFIFALALTISVAFFKKNLIQALLQKQLVLPSHAWGILNGAWIFFFTLIAGVNLYVAYTYTTSQWVNFKLFGVMGMMFLFVVIQGIYLSIKYPQEKDTAGSGDKKS
jgi:intracellular septation protein